MVFGAWGNLEMNKASFSPHALKGQKLLAQGSALGSLWPQACRPVGAKAFKDQTIYKAFALTGRFIECPVYPGRCPGLGASALSGRIEKT